MSRYGIEFYTRDIDNSWRGKSYRTMVPSTEIEREIMSQPQFAHDITGGGGGFGHDYSTGKAVPIAYIDESKCPNLERQVAEKWNITPDAE